MASTESRPEGLHLTMRRNRLLVLATYPRTAAATRFRASAYFDALARSGIDAELHPFFDDQFFRTFYRPGARVQKAVRLLRASIDRALLFIVGGHFDAVFVQREAALLGPALIEALFARVRRLPLIFDFDDAIWIEDVSVSQHPRLAALLKSPRKTIDLLRMATETIAGSNYLAAYAYGFTERVTVSPTVVSRTTWSPLPGRLDGTFASTSGLPVVGWVGTHGTAGFLDVALPALRVLAEQGERFRLRLVGASREVSIPGVEVENVPWSEASEIHDFQRIDVGIAPMPDTPWTRGKCGFKQVQYMTVGVPYVSSPVGGASEIVRHGENGLLAGSILEWRDGVRALLRDADLRARLARAGRADVESRWCTEVQAQSVVSCVERAVARGTRRGAR